MPFTYPPSLFYKLDISKAKGTFVYLDYIYVVETLIREHIPQHTCRYFNILFWQTESTSFQNCRISLVVSFIAFFFKHTTF